MVPTGSILDATTFRVCADDLLSLHRGVLNPDYLLFVVHDVSLWLRRATERLAFRLCRYYLGHSSGGIDWATGETLWRAAVSDHWRILFYGRPFRGTVRRAAQRGLAGPADRRRHYLPGKLARDSCSHQPGIQDGG